MNWSPHNLQHCLDSNALAYLTATLAFGMLIWYCVIAHTWWKSMKYSSGRARKAWFWLVVIFIICSQAGYASWILALAVPKTAVSYRILALVIQNISCPFFMLYARRSHFEMQGREQNIGEQILAGLPHPSSIDDAQLAQIAAEAVIKAHKKFVKLEALT